MRSEEADQAAQIATAKVATMEAEELRKKNAAAKSATAAAKPRAISRRLPKRMGTRKSA